MSQGHGYALATRANFRPAKRLDEGFDEFTTFGKWFGFWHRPAYDSILSSDGNGNVMAANGIAHFKGV